MITLLLPNEDALTGQFSGEWQARLARASRAAASPLFDLSPDAWPLVEATYRLDHDGELPSRDLTWMRLDPANAMPDINGVVMLGFGAMLNLREGEHAALRADVAELLAEKGIVLHWPMPERAYLGVPSAIPVAEFTPTWDVLGDDLLDHFPSGENARTWRSLINDLQIALHGHPVNVARRGRGQHAVNLLWPWRTGVSSDDAPNLRSNALLKSPDAELLAMWDWAGGDAMMRTPISDAPYTTDTIIDLRDQTRRATLEREWFNPALRNGNGKLDLRLDGSLLRIRPRDRFKFWRK